MTYESRNTSQDAESQMSTTLIRPNASLGLSSRTWLAALQLAEAYGWKPSGTALEEEDWDGSYDSNDGAQVSELDARAFARAIKSALPDVPRHDAIMHGTLLKGGTIEIRAFDTSAPQNLFEVFSGESRIALIELAEFCKQGAFRIC